MANSTLIGSQGHGPSHQVLSRLQCEDYQQESPNSTVKRAAAASSTSAVSAATLISSEPEIFYCPNQRRRTRTGERTVGCRNLHTVTGQLCG